MAQIKPRKQQKVVAAYPHGHEVSARFHKSWDALRQYDMFSRQRIANGGGHLANSSGANVTNARNEIIRTFLDHHDADWLWFIDTDMTFESDLLDRLVESAHPTDRPIVGALCFSLQDGFRACPTMYMLRPDGKAGRIFDYPREQMVRCLTGTGCLLVHRSALERIRDRGFSEAYPWCQETNLGTLPIGEDLTFCLRAEALGIPVHVDTRIKCGHEKPFIVDEDMYLAQRQAGVVDAGDTNLPTYVVVASKSRPAMLERLVTILAPTAAEVFVYDNGYDALPLLPVGAGRVTVISAAEWPLHRMWNDGLDRASQATPGPHNVLIVNDDVECRPDLLARLEAGLRVHPDNWLAMPNHLDLALEPGAVAAVAPSADLAGQTIPGWCFMVRGEAGLRFDEQFQWWYGDSDLEKQVRVKGKNVVVVGGAHARHLDPMRSTLDDPGRLAQARADEGRFAAKWQLDPESLWLHRNA